MPLTTTTNPSPGYDSGKILYPVFNQDISVLLPSNVYAFGFDLGAYQPLIASPPPYLAYVELSTGEMFAGYQGNPYPTYAFFGFLSDVSITGLSMDAYAYHEWILDNFTYAQIAAPVPEPTTMLLLGSGLVGLFVMRRKFTKQLPSI